MTFSRMNTSSEKRGCVHTGSDAGALGPRASAAPLRAHPPASAHAALRLPRRTDPSGFSLVLHVDLRIQARTPRKDKDREPSPNVPCPQAWGPGMAPGATAKPRPCPGRQDVLPAISPGLLGFRIRTASHLLGQDSHTYCRVCLGFRSLGSWEAIAHPCPGGTVIFWASRMRVPVPTCVHTGTLWAWTHGHTKEEHVVGGISCMGHPPPMS